MEVLETAKEALHFSPTTPPGREMRAPMADAEVAGTTLIDLETSVSHARLCLAVTIPAMLSHSSKKLLTESGGSNRAVTTTDKEKGKARFTVGDFQLVFGMAAVSGHTKGSRFPSVLITSKLVKYPSSPERCMQKLLARVPIEILTLLWVEQQVSKFSEALQDV